MLMPAGIQTMSMDIEGLVESSTNLGVINNNQDDFVFEYKDTNIFDTGYYYKIINTYFFPDL